MSPTAGTDTPIIGTFPSKSGWNPYGNRTPLLARSCLSGLKTDGRALLLKLNYHPCKLMNQYAQGKSDRLAGKPCASANGQYLNGWYLMPAPKRKSPSINWDDWVYAENLEGGYWKRKRTPPIKCSFPAVTCIQ